jgi:putative ABC transport system permease protein
MFQNYLKTAFRHVLKSKLNFLFKLGGLTLAVSSLLVIIIYVSFQLSFDRYHDDYRNIYRVNARWMENGALASYAIVPPGVGPALGKQFPEIKTFARLGYSTHYQVRYKDKTMRIHGFVNADSTVFDILTFHFIRGDKHALDHPRSIVLTQSLAQQIFGEEDPMGKTISFTDRSDSVFEVSGIIEDMPPNTHLHIRALLPLNALKDAGDLPVDPWEIGIDGSGPLYLRLHNAADVQNFVSKAIPFLRENLISREDHLEKDYEIYLQPIHNIHLDPWIYADFTQKGNVVYVYIFSLLGVFLLVIAGINYVNLSIADFHKRSKEIGVRKVLGARKRQVALQVIFETCFICATSLALSLGMVYFLFPEIVQVLDSNLTFAMLLNPPVTWMVVIITFFLMVISSLYPAWHLAANKSINDFKALGGTGMKSSAGNILLLCQFTISIICICATFIVGQQISFFQTKDPGYDRDNTIVLFMPDRYPVEKIPVIKNELAAVPGVEAVSYSTFLIAGGGYYRDWYRVEINGEMKQMLLNEVFFDHDFFRAMGVELVAGRSFDPNNAADPHAAFIVNETAVREFGWDDPVGKRISYGFEDPKGEKWEGTVVGVVKDFNIYSMRRKIEPLVMRLPWSEWPGNCVHIRIHGPVDEAIAGIKKKYNEILPDFLIDYHLIGELYAGQYQNEKKAFASLQLGTWIIVLISSLGIFSLSAYMSVRRMKEFGIRKILGATVRQIAALHVGHFLRIAVIANLIALPLAFWMMKIWLSEFAYRVQLEGILFFGVMLLSFLLVILSAGYSSWRAGVMNPIDVIKKEN